MFKENSNISIRKIAAFVVIIVFAAATLGNLIVNKFNELPQSYVYVISGVFIFYFGKDVMRNVTLTQKNSNNEKNIDSDDNAIG